MNELNFFRSGLKQFNVAENFNEPFKFNNSSEACLEIRPAFLTAVLESSSDFPETVNEGKKNGFGAFEVWLHHFSSDLN